MPTAVASATVASANHARASPVAAGTVLVAALRATTGWTWLVAV